MFFFFVHNLKPGEKTVSLKHTVKLVGECFLFYDFTLYGRDKFFMTTSLFFC